MSTFLRNFDSSTNFAAAGRGRNGNELATFSVDIASATRLATSAEFAAYLQEEIYERSLMVQSGILATDARMNNITGRI